MRPIVVLAVFLSVAVLPLQEEAKLVTVALILMLGASLLRARPVRI